MARLNVTWGRSRLSVVYPAAAAELAKLLAADLGLAGALTPGLEQDHLIGFDAAGTGAIAAGLITNQFDLAAVLDDTGALAAGFEQTHLAGAAVSGAGDLAPALEQTHELGETSVGTTMLLGAGLFVGHEMSADIAATGALDGALAVTLEIGADLAATGTLAGDLDAQQAAELGADIAATGALAGDLDVEAPAGDPAFRCVAVAYTGTGATQSITGVGFSPEMVIILDAADTSGAERWITQANDVGQHWKPGGDSFPNFDQTQSKSGVTSFDADGFTLGSDGDMNGSGTSYVALCFAAGTGTETANFQAQAFTRAFGAATVAHTLGTTPVWAWSKRDGQAAGEWITDGGLGTDSNDLGGSISANADAVTAVSSSDITIGADTRWGAGSDTGPLILFGGVESAGKYKTGTYTGTGGSGNAITGLGFQPSVVMIRSLDGTGLSVLAAGLSPQTAFVLGDTGNRDAAFTLDADGFTVNGSDEINRSGESFRYFAWV